MTTTPASASASADAISRIPRTEAFSKALESLREAVRRLRHFEDLVINGSEVPAEPNATPPPSQFSSIYNILETLPIEINATALEINQIVDGLNENIL